MVWTTCKCSYAWNSYPRVPNHGANRFLFPRQAIWVGSYHLHPKGLTGSLRPPKEKGCWGTYLVAQWLRRHLPRQGTQVRPLVRMDGLLFITILPLTKIRASVGSWAALCLVGSAWACFSPWTLITGAPASHSRLLCKQNRNTGSRDLLLSRPTWVQGRSPKHVRLPWTGAEWNWGYGARGACFSPRAGPAEMLVAM